MNNNNRFNHEKSNGVVVRAELAICIHKMKPLLIMHDIFIHYTYIYIGRNKTL